MSGTVDLTTSGSFGAIGDAIFTTDTTHSAGTGGFNTFVQLQHKGTEQGYNTDASPQFDEKNSHVHNHALLLADVPIFFGDGSNGTIEGVAYREFKLDINEASRFLSLDKLQIWQEDAGNLTNFNSDGSGFGGAGNLVYDMDAGGDAWVALNGGLSSGSGGGDMRLLIRDDLFINDGDHRYVYLYSMFGLQGGAWASDGGFEEWGTATPTGGSSGGAVLHLDKTASVDGGTADTAGEVITYTYTVSNFGSVALTGITVTDAAVSDLVFVGGDTNNNNALDTTETWTYAAHHTVTQADIDDNGQGSGTIDNTGTADSNQTGPVSDSASVVIQRDPHILVTKTATIPDVDGANDPTLHDGKIDSPDDDISYTITLFNDGNTTLHNLVVNDSLLGSLTTHSEIGGTGVNGDDILDVGETWTFTGWYDVTQADIDNRGSVDGTPDDNIHNDVTVESTDAPTAGASADVAIDYRPSLAFAKAGTFLDDNHDGYAQAGEHISYSFTLSNTGNVTLHDVTVSDAASGVAISGSAIAALGPGQSDSTTWSGSYAITQADIENGSYQNTALAAATEASTPDTETVDLPPAPPAGPVLALVKTSSELIDSDESGGPSVADDIQYFFSVTNNGAVALHGLQLDDDLFGMIAFTPDSPDGNGLLDPGETWLLSRTYITNSDDISHGFVDNEATVTGLDPSNAMVTSNTAFWHLEF